MDKTQLLEEIRARIAADHRSFMEAARDAHRAATDPQNRPDNKYDTLSLEASYLAQGAANRAAELREWLTVFEALPLRRFGPDDPVGPTAWLLVEDPAGGRRRFFMAPRAGGMSVASGEWETTLVTPESPLGRALAGKREGDTAAAAVAGAPREWEILEVR